MIETKRILHLFIGQLTSTKKYRYVSYLLGVLIQMLKIMKEIRLFILLLCDLLSTSIQLD